MFRIIPHITGAAAPRDLPAREDDTSITVPTNACQDHRDLRILRGFACRDYRRPVLCQNNRIYPLKNEKSNATLVPCEQRKLRGKPQAPAHHKTLSRGKDNKNHGPETLSSYFCPRRPDCYCISFAVSNQEALSLMVKSVCARDGAFSTQRRRTVCQVTDVSSMSSRVRSASRPSNTRSWSWMRSTVNASTV
jgi:hypothetical protein